ncbi:ribosomal L1 [Fusarium beomiforme]|uniref:Ribosomal L1 n=1 Tax=Fusarium beomiforme TaxID=44412 RepID=A0A9P5DQQ8_9HYPO|nr:ribosomal L1 [Fusarium beomiforme]
MRQQPSRDVLDAFGAGNNLIHVPGGRGLCYQDGQGVLLRPSDDDEESEYIGSLCKLLVDLNPIDYGIPEPILASGHPEKYVCDGWTAWTYVEGNAIPQGNFKTLMRACRAFHADTARLVTVKPLFISTRKNRFTEADLVAWEEKKLEDVEGVNTDIMAVIQPTLDQLHRLRQPFQQEMKSQLIHGDLTGNVLFDTESNNPPTIIDITLYWRPAEYAEAIIVADGLIWLKEGRELVDMHGFDHTRMQLLVRALYWRCLSFAIDPILPWVNENLPKADFGKAIEIVKEMMNEYA